MPWPESEAEQLARLRRHVENEVPEAINYLGNAYREGDLGLRSDKKTVKLYKRAVELGDVIAMLNLGCSYDHGQGVKMNKKKALQLYRMAADRGYARAQCNLGHMLLEEETDESQREAFELYKLSAAQGLTNALYQVGFCYVNGEGTEVDFVEGKRWLERAAAKGHKGAIRGLEVLAGRHSS
jgi:TPR repeat protein